MHEISPVKGSFRDPSGFVFHSGTMVLRWVNKSYEGNYIHLMQSGLYDEAIRQELLISHVDIPDEFPEAHRILKPELIPFVSYPYEWCFSQLKDAALTVLRLQRLALVHGMTLKDSSAYNIQFLRGKPIWIDTLSFENYDGKSPWIAYRQFCQHFLAPLAMMKWCDPRTIHLMKSNIDGIPLDMASNLLPRKTWLNFGILIHLHLHSRSQMENTTIDDYRNCTVNLHQILGLIDSLESTIVDLSNENKRSLWVEYYQDTNYSTEAKISKHNLVVEYLKSLKPGTLWDIGGNIGIFTDVAAANGFDCVLLDSDSGCIERCYSENKKSGEKHILPLCIDISNPSPGIGWNNQERGSLSERIRPDTILALALIHHLAIGNNIPMKELARFFSENCNNLIIEFVPKSDSQVKRLLMVRQDIFSDYTRRSFEYEFFGYFSIKRIDEIKESGRILYLMEKKE